MHGGEQVTGEKVCGFPCMGLYARGGCYIAHQQEDNGALLGGDTLDLLD